MHEVVKSRERIKTPVRFEQSSDPPHCLRSESIDIMPCNALAYSTDSAGMHPTAHTLPLKLRAIAAAGFTHVELAFSDLEAYCAQQHPDYKELDNAGRGDVETLTETAAQVREMCEKLGVKVLVVHP